MSILGILGDGLTGPAGGAAPGNPIGGLVSSATGAVSHAVLQNVSSWILDGSADALREVAAAIGTATRPNLETTWFSSTYWRVAALAAMLTIPFLCAAAVQALARADIAQLARAALGYLPLSLLGVSLAAPLTMLLLAATDQMSGAVSAGAATDGARFLLHAARTAGALAVEGSPFFAVFIGLLTVMAALALAVELLVRTAAVYVVVLMLPLAFAALVWPARRVWAARLVELLVSLILSKFAIVAVLSLAASALGGGTTDGISELLVAMSLITLSTFAPWALMRMLPFTEVAAGAAGMLRHELSQSGEAASMVQLAAGGTDQAGELAARLRHQATRMLHASPGGEAPAPTGSASGAVDGWASGEPELAASAEPAVSASREPEAATGDGQATADASPVLTQAAEGAEAPPAVSNWPGDEKWHLDGDMRDLTTPPSAPGDADER
jgi:type IV secretion system protein TrbL